MRQKLRLVKRPFRSRSRQCAQEQSVSVNNMFKLALLSQKIDSFCLFFLQVGLAVQFVSNCHSSSKREAYVRELRRFIPVDIYGKCGEFKCAKEKGWQCYKEAEAKYKFYLAFENSV